DHRRQRQAVETGSLKGLPRGIAFRLIEAGGLIDRRDVARDLAALSQVERRTLRTFAIRVGTHSVWLPGLMKPRARAFALAFTGTAPLTQSASPTGLIPTPPVAPSARALSAMALRHLGPWLAPVEALETLGERRTAAASAEPGRPPRLTPDDLAALGWTEAQARQITQALKTDRARLPDKPGTAPRPVKDSPFAALAALTPEAPTRKAQRRRGR
ncbi:MAG: phosphonate-binding protein, partial [Brevundimonas sp.]|nr:phosphonate-binding protein [Brevundimonas sp.]